MQLMLSAQLTRLLDTSKRVYVESRASASRAAADFRLDGRHETFTIQARSISLQVSMDNFGTMTAAQGSVVQLGLISNRPSYFVLSGGEGGRLNPLGRQRARLDEPEFEHTGFLAKLRDICVSLLSRLGNVQGALEHGIRSRWVCRNTVCVRRGAVEVRRALLRYTPSPAPRPSGLAGHYSFINAPSKLAFLPTFRHMAGRRRRIVCRTSLTASTGTRLESHELIVLKISEASVIKDVERQFSPRRFRKPDAAHWNLLLDKMTNSETRNSMLMETGAGPPPAQDLTNLTLA
ncbi:hypothetical protein J3459_018417 [Metarhizium acridum]|nr:hypothetical protein J3459_018417 [Metarhizium acridum]